MGSNTLTPRLDKSININEMGPDKLTTLHTQIHAVWEGLMQGRYFDDWTFEDCKKIHADILTKMKSEKVKHIMLNSTLDTGMSEVQVKINDMLKKQNIDSTERSDLIQTINKQQQQIDKILKNKSTIDEEMNRIKNLLESDKKINSNEKIDLLSVIAKQQEKISETIINNGDIKNSIDNIKGLLNEGKQLREEEKDDLKNALTEQSEKFVNVMKSFNVIDEFKKLHEAESESKKDIINSILKKQSESEDKANDNITMLIKFQKEQVQRHEDLLVTFDKKQNEQAKKFEEKEKNFKEKEKQLKVIEERKLSFADLKQSFSGVNEISPSHIGVLGFNEKGYTTDEEVNILIKQKDKCPEIEEAILNGLSSIRSRIKFYYLGSEGVDKFKSYIPLFSIGLNKVNNFETKVIKENLSGEVPDTEEKKDIAKLPKEIKSNIKDLLLFAKEQGCPGCKSKMIRLVGFMENGTSAKFGCVNCQILWVVSKASEDKEEGYSVYNYEKVELGKVVWDKVYPNLIKQEKKFNNAISGVFKNIETKYDKAFDSGKRKFADNVIGQSDLQVTLQAEMEEIAYNGEITVAKDLKRPVPKALNPNAVKWIDTYSLKLAGDVAKDIQENIRLQIAEGIKEGAGVREIKKRINSVFSEGMRVNVPAKIENGKIVRKAYTRFVTAETRVRAISQTETIRAFNRGRYESIQDIKEITGWRYEASADERTCEICMGLDGQEFKKEDDTNLPPNPHVSCFINWKSPVLTSKGYKPIGKIKVNDLVLTHKGKFKPVERILNSQKYKGEVIKIETEYENWKGKPRKYSITVTPEHPIFINSKEIIPASLLKEGNNINLIGKECIECGKIFPMFNKKENTKYCSLTCANKATAIEQFKDEKQHTIRSIKANKQMKKEYKNGTRDRFEITKKANEKARDLIKEGIFVSQKRIGISNIELYGKGKAEEISKNISEKVKQSKYHKNGTWSKGLTKETNNMLKRKAEKEKQRYIDNPELRMENSERNKKYFREHPEKHPNFIMAQKGFISKPQKEMFEIIKKEYKNAKLEYPIKTKYSVKFADVAIIDKKIVCEYDGKRWHEGNEEKDLQRDNDLREVGWNTLRFNKENYKNCIKEIKAVCMNHNGLYKFLKLKVVKITKRILKKPVKLFNFAVKDDESYIVNGFVVHNCRCTFGYIFGKKQQEKPIVEVKKNVKPKFKLKKNSGAKCYEIEVPGLKDEASTVLKLETKEKDIGHDIGWIEKGVQLKEMKEYFLHGKKTSGRWISNNKILKKANNEVPYVLSGKGYVPEKDFSALPKGLMARIPRNLRWYELSLQGEEAKKMIKAVTSLLFKKEEPTIKVREMTTEEEIKMMLKKVSEVAETNDVENQINFFLNKHEYKVHKHACSLDTFKLEKLEGWPQKKTPFKLPLPVSGIALTTGAFRGMSGEWVYYGKDVIEKSAPLLTGCQIRVDHSEDGAPLSTVAGWVTKSWKGKDKRGNPAILYKGLIFDYDKAKDIYNKKIRKTSVSPFVKEKVDEIKGLVAEDIAKFEEISILTGNNPACPKATVVAS